MDIPAQFTRRTLAEFCAMSVKQLDRHIKANTLKLGDATKREPGLGIRIKGSKARAFIEAMAAKRSQTA